MAAKAIAWSEYSECELAQAKQHLTEEETKYQMFQDACAYRRSTALQRVEHSRGVAVAATRSETASTRSLGRDIRKMTRTILVMMATMTPT